MQTSCLGGQAWGMARTMIVLAFIVMLPTTMVYSSQFMNSKQGTVSKNKPFIDTIEKHAKSNRRARGVEEEAPVVSDFQINNGAQFSSDRLVSLNHVLSVLAGDYYRASQNQNLSGALWMPYASNPILYDRGRYPLWKK